MLDGWHGLCSQPAGVGVAPIIEVPAVWQLVWEAGSCCGGSEEVVVTVFLEGSKLRRQK